MSDLPFVLLVLLGGAVCLLVGAVAVAIALDALRFKKTPPFVGNP